MSMTAVNDTAIQLLCREFWSDIFVPEVMQATMLPSLVSREYEGEIQKAGDKVYISQMVRPTATRKTVGVGHETFNSEKLVPLQVSVTADQVITASFKFDNLVQLQSQVGDQDSKIRQGLVEAMDIALNEFCYSIVAASTTAPDHDLGSVTDFNAAQLLAVRKLAAKAKWSKKDGKGWWLLADPSYYGDMLAAATLIGGDYVPDMPSVGGEFAQKRQGFYILEDNSDALITHVSAGTEDAALAFHPDFMHLVVQQAPVFKISDLHPLQQHGYLISASMVCGAALGVNGDEKHIVIR